MNQNVICESVNKFIYENSLQYIYWAPSNSGKMSISSLEDLCIMFLKFIHSPPGNI